MLGLVLLGVFTLYIAVRLLHLASQSAAPTLHYADTPVNRAIVNACSLLTEIYKPPLLWGKSGHLQTFIYGKLGRVKSPFPKGERVASVTSDGATITFDIFEPYKPHPSGEDYMLVVCPGIANSSESLYICTCVDYAQNCGYRVAVLNHLGALKHLKLTQSRIFTYGGTEEYGTMVDKLCERYPDTKMVATGFSMGGNIVLKYVGERKENEAKFVGAMSFCQGYDPAEAVPYLMNWDNMRRVYLWAMTQHQKSMMRAHKDVLFGPEAQQKYGPFDTKKIFACTTLLELDEHYNCRRAGYTTREEYYVAEGCRPFLENIDIPTFILNTMDDPIVPNELLYIPKQLADKKPNVIFATTQHGGHLGFFEGSNLIPDTITWLDKIVVQFADALASTHSKMA